VTLFGTTGEGASLGTSQRAAMLEALDDAGIDLASQVLAGVSASAVEDAVAQANQLFDAGGCGILLGGVPGVAVVHFVILGGGGAGHHGHGGERHESTAHIGILTEGDRRHGALRAAAGS